VIILTILFVDITNDTV